MKPLSLILSLTFFAATIHAEEALPYVQHQDVQYSTAKDQPLYMDVFIPTGENRPPEWKPNDHGKGLAIVDVAVGAWHSDRGKINDHKEAQMYTIFCSRGYTVFAVRTGSQGDFTALEQLANLKQAICHVKQSASLYSVDPNRLGITGASAGGHLASLAVLTAEPARPEAENPLERCDTSVKAAGIFFPPTDFLDWGGKPLMEVAQRLENIFFMGGIAGKTEEEIAAAAKAISPRHLVKEKTIPFMIFHGDADDVVPLQQSEVFVDALQQHGTDAKLYIKPGGTHPWMTIPIEVVKLADWFDHQLAGAPAPETLSTRRYAPRSEEP